jgi:hypothetical protein
MNIYTLQTPKVCPSIGFLHIYVKNPQVQQTARQQTDRGKNAYQHTHRREPPVPHPCKNQHLFPGRTGGTVKPRIFIRKGEASPSLQSFLLRKKAFPLPPLRGFDTPGPPPPSLRVLDRVKDLSRVKRNQPIRAGSYKKQLGDIWAKICRKVLTK